MFDRVGVVGIGRLGLCLALNLERSGFEVCGFDIDHSRMAEIASKTFRSVEPGLEEALASASNFRVVNTLGILVEVCDVIFITVRTETSADGSYDVSQVDSVIDGLIDLGPATTVKTIVINCNVNPGYTDSRAKILENLNYSLNFNPEWVAQGSIMRDQLFPDVVVIGERSVEQGDKIQKIYERLCETSPVIHRMDPTSAELVKVSLNCFLTTKISFANMVGDLAIRSGLSPDPILAAIGSDSRIGSKFLRYGFGYGGPCFPRDTRALVRYAELKGIKPSLIIATRNYNELHLEYQLEEIQKTHKQGSTIVVDGVAYKKGVDILEESFQLKFALRLSDMGYLVIIKDIAPVISQVRSLHGDKFEYQEQ